MWYLRVVDQPAQEPITVDDVKAQSRIDYSDEDGLLSGYITAARQQVEGEISRALITQTLELGLDGFPCGDRILIPRGNLQSVISVKYRDTAEIEYTMQAGTDYLVNQYAEPAEIVLPWNKIWPAAILSPAAPVRIQYTCGWDGADRVPQPIKQAMLMLIADWYTNREDVVIGRTSAVATALPNGLKRLLAGQKLYYSGPGA